MKAIAGAALITGAVLLDVTTLGAAAGLTAVEVTALMGVLGSAGVSMVAGSIAEALTQNRGMGVTIRQPAANRNFVYGMQRVGGVSIFESTTGSGPAQRNYVIVLADHECYAINGLYLDGRQVFFKGSGPGYSVRNGVGFGGNADSNDHADEGGNKYNFGSLVYTEARYGDQLPGDVMASLTANDGRWKQTAGGSPYVGGCTYIYLKVEADNAMFPSDPEIRITIQGKSDIWDPRTNTVGYTENWALCLADAFQNSEYGVGELRSNINTAQLIAAANICDEQVFSPVAGANESRYTINGGWDSATSPGDLIASMLPAAQGRVSYIGGEWYIFPAAWVPPSFTFNEGDILNTSVNWNPAKKIRERYNRVRGTFTAPKFPFAVSGNLYDSNGFAEDGSRANLFGLEWMAESYPDYAEDSLHGYSTDRWLTADQGIERVLNLDLKCTISLATAQRLAKIALLRNRLGAGTTTLTMSLAAYQVIPCDVIQVNFAPLGWVNKLLEVVGVQFRADYPDDGPPRLVVDLSVQETDPAIYEWNPSTEELTINDVAPLDPGTTYSNIYSVAAPSNIAVVSNSSTAITTPDGIVTPRLGVSWIAAADAFATQYQLQYMAQGSSTWLDAPMVTVPNAATYISGIVPGTSYNVRVRSVRPNGAASAWVASGSQSTTVVYSQINTNGIAPTLPGL